MVFNKSWVFLKSLEDEQAIKESKEYMDMMEQARRAQLFPNHPEYTIENDFQTTLPMHDFTLDENTGYAGVPPVTAIRYTGDYRAGSPVAQGDFNTNFEGTESSGYFPKKVPDVDFNAPSVNAPHGKLAPKGWKNRPPTDKDADYGYPDKGGWLYRDPESGAHYWYKNGIKRFMDVKEGAMGSWWSYPTEEDFDRAAGSEMNPTKIIGLRGDPSKYGIVSQRDSSLAPEELAEMYLLHSKNIPRHALVETALRENIPGKRNENRMDAALRAGIPKRIGATSRWSNKPLPFSTSRVKKPFEDLTEEELYGLAGMDTPMKKAFQLLKNIQEDEETGLFNMNENMLYDYFNNFDPEKQDENSYSARERLDEYGNIIDYDEQDYEDSIKELDRYFENQKRENSRLEPSNIKRPPMSLLPEDHPEYTTHFEWKNRKLASEPMQIAFQLLKAQQTLYSYDPDSVEELLHPNKRTVFISSKPNWVNKENPMSEEKQSELHDNLLAELGALENKKGMKIISARGKSVEWGDEHSIALSNVPDHHFDNIMGLATKYEQDSVLHSPKGTSSGELLKPSGEVDFPLGEGGFVNDAENMTEFNTGQRFAYGEPMNIAFQLLKERKSPAAFAHKLEYDKQYQKDPKRVKYREQLNTERRKRGIYGKGGKDVSHTQGGKLTLESAHSNRARHFKNKGTLRRVKVKK